MENRSLLLSRHALHGNDRGRLVHAKIVESAVATSGNQPETRRGHVPTTRDAMMLRRDNNL